jgi:alpha-galactosidase
MLVVGHVGWGPQLHPTGLSPDEQRTHISLWCLLAAPLLLGCDLTRLDDFTLSLLTNDEVLAVHQDPLGRQAVQVVSGPAEIWARPLEDGSLAVGLFNLHDRETQMIRVEWSALGLLSPASVRDLWQRADCGVHGTGFEVRVPSHGATMIRVSPQPG